MALEYPWIRHTMKKIIDLTLTYQSGMRGVKFDTVKTLKRDGWNAKILHLYSHSGTHMDAPLHFGVNKQTIDQIPLEKCLGPAWIVGVLPAESRQLITIEHLGEIKSQFSSGDSLLIKTGWSDKIHTTEYRDSLPRISEELAIWCANNRVKMLGVEPPSVADVNNREELTRIHQILLGGEVIIVEGLCNLDKISLPKVQFMAIPLKIYEGDGAPCRAFAWYD
jgi:arylformamidase